ncbi:MAG TPA: DUF1345 domain-containing protein [Allosphingosinicella sp.]|nr:DUF1345 domain-containing protein [Allosphingosinicella sp.]
MRVRHTHFILFLLAFACVTGAFALHFPFDRSILYGFDIASAGYSALTLSAASRARADLLRTTAARNDAGRGFLLLIAALLLAVILISVGTEFVHRKHMPLDQLVLVVLTLALAWLFGNLVCARHYAHLFYDQRTAGGDREGLIFPGTPSPDLRDFIYFALVLGMTFQVSDVQIASPRIRRMAAIHGALAFFFNIGVVALTVNVLGSAT